MTELAKKPRKRFFQFSLRSFLLFYLIFPPLAIAGAYEWYQSNLRLEEIELARKQGNRVIFKYEIDGNGYLIPNASSLIPDRFRRIQMITTTSIDEWASNHPQVTAASLLTFHTGDTNDLTFLSPIDKFKSISINCERGPHASITSVKGIETQTNLESLELKYSSWIKDQSFDLAVIDNLPALNTLRLEWAPATNVDKLNNTNLKRIFLVGIPAERLDFRNYKSLEEISIFGCRGLRDVDLTGLPNLKRVSIKTQNLNRLAIDNWLQVESLELTDCPALEGIDGFPNRHRLKHINLTRCPELKIDLLSTHERPNELNSLTILACEQLPRFNFENQFPGLEKLDLYRTNIDFELSGISELVKLREVSLRGMTQEQDLDSFANMKQLRSIVLSGDKRLSDLGGLASLMRLTSLSLIDCTALTNLNGLPQNSVLDTVDLAGCSLLQDINALAGLSQLFCVDLSHCPKLENVSPLHNLEQLRSLTLMNCKFKPDTAAAIRQRFKRHVLMND